MISEKELKNYLDLKDKIEERILEIFYYSSNYEPNGGYNYFEIEGDLPKILPSFLGEDVTNNSYYKNKNLSKLA